MQGEAVHLATRTLVQDTSASLGLPCLLFVSASLIVSFVPLILSNANLAATLCFHLWLNVGGKMLQYDDPDRGLQLILSAFLPLTF